MSKKFKGYLDRLRENVEVLDEQIQNARAMSKAQKSEDSGTALQWTKTVRDLVELRNTTLFHIKTHLLGRDETGAANEPLDYYESDPLVMFERAFQVFLAPWTEDDFKLKCEDCGVNSEEVSNHTFTHPYPQETECIDLCEKCHEKRCEDSESNEEDDDAKEVAEPVSAEGMKLIRQTAALTIKALRYLPSGQRTAKLEEMLADKVEVAPGMEPAYEAYRVVLQKELDNTKAAISAEDGWKMEDGCGRVWDAHKRLH